MIEIFIDEKTKIVRDGINWAVAFYQPGKSKDGKYDWRAKYFFSKISHIMDWLVEEKLMNSDAKSFVDIEKNVEELKESLTKQINELNA
jgi:hypothetical protein